MAYQQQLEITLEKDSEYKIKSDSVFILNFRFESKRVSSFQSHKNSKKKEKLTITNGVAI